MDYYLEGKHYSISYSALKEQYIIHKEMSDDEFLANLPSALHTACIISWFKELPAIATLSDIGIVHELAHLLHLGPSELVQLSEIRKLFNTTLKLD